jgi:glycosyltransferase involved in cell wall biosynthesis
LEKLVIHHGLEEHVKLLDFMTDEELVLWINAADVFVFPSIKESFGITQLNALACGIPVVASKNVGSREIICDKCGLLYDTEKFSELGDKIFECINDISWDKYLIRDYVVKNYSWERISKQLIELYKELI